MMKILHLGQSTKKRDITGYLFKNGEKENQAVVLIIATTHGDEMEGLWLSNHFKDIWMNSFPYSNLQVLLIPELNPDGVVLCTRTNGSGVDINRNLPTKDWDLKIFDDRYPPGPYANSEPESKILVMLIKKYQPVAILSLHSYRDPQINANGNNETGVIELANFLYDVSPYKKITVGDEIGYLTPGCLGTYAGFERGIPTITYELLRGTKKNKIISENRKVIERFLEFFERKIK